jgi:PKD repeat protein
MQPGDTCTATTPCTSAITGLAFYTGGEYPAAYDGALFFADYGRHGIWVIFTGADGLPDPTTRAPFITSADNPVQLRIGPNGDLFYADLTGTIYRVKYYAGNQPPIASVQAAPGSGAPPLTVAFDGSGSSDPDGDPIAYAWDLDDDGQFDDSTAARPSYTFTQAGNRIARLKVTDNKGAFSIASVTISVGNTPPTALIDTPIESATWKVGDTITFTGHATDAQEGALPSTALSWTIVLHHCYSPADCHEHLVQDYTGTASGSFAMPDHEDLPYLEIRLTATDSGGLSDMQSVMLDPLTTTLALRSSPSGLQLILDSDSVTTPADQIVVAGSTHTLIAPEVQHHRSFDTWADGSTQQVRTIAIGTTEVIHSVNYLNKPPVAGFTATPIGGPASLAVAFSGAQSSDPEGDSLSYRWDFGDDTTADEPAIDHSYGAPGIYRVVLTVTDALGMSTSQSIQLNVREATVSELHPALWLPLVVR